MNNMVIIVVAVILVGVILIIARNIKQDKERLEFLINGTQFEANIIGVTYTDNFRSENTDTFPVGESERLGRIKVKITYIHPFSQKEVIVYKMLDRRDYKDNRLTTEANSDTEVKDTEGYTILTPPVIAEGYLLNCEVMFVQKTNTRSPKKANIA